MKEEQTALTTITNQLWEISTILINISAIIAAPQEIREELFTAFPENLERLKKERGNG